MTDVTMGLKRAALEKGGFGKYIKGKSQEDGCAALGNALKEWMKQTKYAFASCTVTPAGKEDFKVVVTLKKEAKETDAEAIRSYITGHSR